MLAGYCKKNQRKTSKKACERYQGLSEEEKNNSIVANDVEVAQKMKNRLVEYRKKRLTDVF